MRLDNYVSKSANISRSQAKLVIKQGRVYVNSKKECNPAFKTNDTDNVQLDKKILVLQGKSYIALHKPQGYVCSHEDDGHPSALKLIPSSFQALKFAGRLDADTTGLALLSNDGDWIHRVTSPKQKKKHSKSYQVCLAEPISDEDIIHLEKGIKLKNEDKPTLPCSIDRIDEKNLTISISEGKYHQVKRMFAACGNKVTRLHRYCIGSITLAELESGEHRHLTKEEVNYFYHDA